MILDRRYFIALAAAATGPSAAASPGPAAAAGYPTAALGLDATHFGLRPGSPDDQSRILQRAIDESAHTRTPLAVPPGVYRVGDLKLSTGAQLLGIRGATRLVHTQGPSLVSGIAADHVTLAGLVLDGGGRPLPERRGLVQLEHCRAIKIVDCEINGSGRNALACVAVAGEVSDTTLADAADAAIHVLDAAGLVIARNRISGAGNNGIQVWRSVNGDDGTIVIDNRIESIDNRSGGSGQYGNAINVFRAANVIVHGNRLKNCAFSGVRGNGSSNLQIEGNSISDTREVALYAEFGFEGAVIANNSVDRAAIGISITNFNAGGRLAVVQGNIIRNLLPDRPAGTDPADAAGVGISVEADTAVTGNVVENAPTAGIMLGWGHYLRDIAVTGNVVRNADIGVAVSVTPGAGTALIANNVISETRRGAIVGMARSKAVTGDLAKAGVEQYAHIMLSANRVR
jgi:uncharacterized secreted repeat protein (TIGR03808 family)